MFVGRHATHMSATAVQVDSTFDRRSPKSILAEVLALAVGGALVIILLRLDINTTTAAVVRPRGGRTSSC